MDLHAVKISENFADMRSLERLNQEAFTEEERMGAKRLVRLAEDEKIELAAVYDGDTFVGFYALRIQPPIIYMLYLAIVPSKRSKGYGGKTLQMLDELYPDFQIVLETEKLDERAENSGQREARKRFYLRNGYFETGYCLSYDGLVFEVLCNQRVFDKDSFQALLQKISSPKFQPRLFRE